MTVLSKYLSKGTVYAVLISVLSMVLLYCLVPYSTGYGFERVTVLSSVLHGYIVVLPAALVMLWVTRKRYEGLEVSPAWTGLMVILFGLLCYMAGFKANQKYVAYFAGHVLILGMVVWMLGWKYFLKAFWLWVFLGMMWPLLPLIDIISFPLRKIATQISVGLWNVFGGGAMQNGTSILSKGSESLRDGEAYSLQIAAACSGMRSLFALIMISLMFAYVGVKKEVHRFVVVGVMIPVAIFGNVVRIMLLLGGTVLWGNEFAVGTDAEPSGYHLGAGFLVYFIALFCMLLLVTMLNGGLAKFFKRKKVISKKVGGGPT